jgi:uncharacterized protein (TIGR03032 family)
MHAPEQMARDANWRRVLGSRYLTSWLAANQRSLALTTYQTGKLFQVRREDMRISVFERTFICSMGLWASPNDQIFRRNSKDKLWRFGKTLAIWVLHRGYEERYVSRAAYTTGDLDIHNLAVKNHSCDVFVATHFNCPATFSERPELISSLIPEDRCHLKELVMWAGRTRHVIVVWQSDVADGWRDRHKNSGCLIDAASNDIVASGLSIPHSPSWYQDKLWVLNSGTDEFGSIDLEQSRFEPPALSFGTPRSLAFAGHYAVVTLSWLSSDLTFSEAAQLQIINPNPQILIFQSECYIERCGG